MTRHNPGASGIAPATVTCEAREITHRHGPQRMDEIEGLFPVPLLRARKLLDAGLVAALARQIHGAHTSRNARSTLLSHTEAVSPGANDLYRRLAQVAGPKVVEFGTLLFGEPLLTSPHRVVRAKC